MRAPSLIHVGKIKAPHGLQGALRVISYTEDPETLLRCTHFLNAQGDPLLTLNTHVATPTPRCFILTFQEARNREAAETLKGTPLYVTRDSLSPISTNQFYHDDLVGIAVHNIHQEPVGYVHAIHNFGAGDLLEIKPSEGETFFVAFREEFVPHVSLIDGYLVINTETTNAE